MRFFNWITLIIFCVMPSAFTGSVHPVFIAHRGASELAPENTLSSVQLAWNLGSKGVEIDIRLTADQKIVLMHDGNTLRTTGVSLEVAETNLEMLKSLDVGKRLKGGRFLGEKIATLEEILATVPPHSKLFIEIKSGTEIIKPLSEILSSYPNPDRLAIIAFDYETLRLLKQNHPAIEAYWLLGSAYRHIIKNPTNRKSLISMAKYAKFDGIDVEKSLARLAFQKETQWAGLKFLVWVVNDSGSLSQFVNSGVDGITTDRPENMFLEKAQNAYGLDQFDLRTVL